MEKEIREKIDEFRDKLAEVNDQIEKVDDQLEELKVERDATAKEVARLERALEAYAGKTATDRAPRVKAEDADRRVLDVLGKHDWLGFCRVVAESGLSESQTTAALKRLIANGAVLTNEAGTFRQQMFAVTKPGKKS